MLNLLSLKWALVSLHDILFESGDKFELLSLSLMQPWTSRGSPRVPQWSQEASCPPSTAQSWEATIRWDCSRLRRKGWGWSNRSCSGRDHRSGFRAKAFHKYFESFWEVPWSCCGTTNLHHMSIHQHSRKALGPQMSQGTNTLFMYPGKTYIWFSPLNMRHHSQV